MTRAGGAGKASRIFYLLRLDSEVLENSGTPLEQLTTNMEFIKNYKVELMCRYKEIIDFIDHPTVSEYTSIKSEQNFQSWRW